MAGQPQVNKSDNSILNRIAFRGIVYQVLLGTGIALLGWYLYTNIN